MIRVGEWRKRACLNLVFILLILMILPGCSQSPLNRDEQIVEPEDQKAQPYFGLEFPTSLVTRFAPSIFKEEMHAPPIFTPDGREVYWSNMGDPGGVRYMTIDRDVWTDPAPAPFDLLKRGDSPFISSDGNHLLFLAWSASGDEIIRQVDRENGNWGSSRTLPDEVNRNGAHWQASVADNGNLYFGSGGQIYFSELVDGNYTEAKVLDLFKDEENGFAGSPYISPDESYLIFDVAENPYADLFITFSGEGGEWSDPTAMEVLNSAVHDLYANVSPDGQFLMFLSNRSGGMLLPYWVDAQVIEDYRP